VTSVSAAITCPPLAPKTGGSPVQPSRVHPGATSSSHVTRGCSGTLTTRPWSASASVYTLCASPCHFQLGFPCWVPRSPTVYAEPTFQRRGPAPLSVQTAPGIPGRARRVLREKAETRNSRSRRRLLRHASVPRLLAARCSCDHDFGYPAGSGSAALRRTMLPNRLRVS
jgi:hypothetical protein